MIYGIEDETSISIPPAPFCHSNEILTSSDTTFDFSTLNDSEVNGCNPPHSLKRSLYSLKEHSLQIKGSETISEDAYLNNDVKQNIEMENRFITVSKEAVEVWDAKFFEEWDVDMLLHTEDGGQVAAQSKVLASHSCVFDEMITVQQLRNLSPPWHLTVKGVPHEALRCFIRFLYSSQYEEEDMKKYVLHLLALSHVYSIPSLKHVCTKELKNGILDIENCTDALQVARMCHAPILSAICEEFIVLNFKEISITDGWRVLKENNPQLEKELFEASVEFHAIKTTKEKKMEEDRVYGHLHGAVKALYHICHDGCNSLKSQSQSQSPSSSYPSSTSPFPPSSSSSSSTSPYTSSSLNCEFSGCKGIQLLIRHFANCQIKVSGGCLNCKRVWQLLELHSRICDETESCKVPLCRHFKEKRAMNYCQNEDKWNIVVKNVLNSKDYEKPFNGHLDFPI